MDDREKSYLRHIRTTYAELDGWQARVQRVEEPERGSELAMDDRVFPKQPTSETVRLSLASASEHLRAVRTTIEAQQIYPTATFTTLRGALVGAAQGVWILSPDDAVERQQRSLTMVRESYKQLRVYDHEALKGAWLTNEQRTQTQAHVQWIDTRLAQVDELRATREHLDLTNIVLPGALAAAFSDIRLQAAGILQWRRMGGDAHVLAWSIAQRSTFAGAPNAAGLSVGSAVGDMEETAEHFMLAHRLLRVGWGLFDRRCEGP